MWVNELMREQGRIESAEARERAKWQAVVADNEKALADKEKALADKEKALADNEKALADKEKALADKDAEIARLLAQLEGSK
jgi:microtubule-associated protein 1